MGYGNFSCPALFQLDLDGSYTYDDFTQHRSLGHMADKIPRPPEKLES